ncbi:uncharacterized protein DSM5745_00536 [Aspergillus mulundensis]|uniref:Peptidase S9 prolyl oligopeptidase catalytic domain-containing protein n=1 Tax=Aspergillus mulundensis TaxID=1810919 RepID=A0A3D8T3T5_9EURO|nr:Uncharacterized protein DSM5745_00536 [Aspergillus mulundensis]RDW93214.1 Uncharacterized protein DSM5745_00536 [Aspergillus mulundensis]
MSIIVALCGIRVLSEEGYMIPPQYPLNHEVSNVQFSEEWQVLGPFQCGTREAIWGADPLEYRGGFRNLSFDEKAEYASPLSTDGRVKWGQAWANVTNSHAGQSRAELMVAFPEVNWPFLQSVYGWSAKQYQAWARGYLYLHGSNRQAVAIFTDGILDLSIDGKRHFGGDFYSYRRAPLVLDITPGVHLVELRLIRDVRALGGQGDPTIHVVVELEIRYGTLTIDERSLLIPEATEQKLGSSWASINVQNNAREWVEILSLYSPNVGVNILLDFWMHGDSAMYLVLLGDRGPIAPCTVSDSPTGLSIHCWQSVELRVSIRSSLQGWPTGGNPNSLFQSQRITYAHPAGIISYAILRPPPLHSPCASIKTNASLPLIIGLHGAGLDADSVQARGMLDAAYGICAWMLFPSGVTSWSGDDWHIWGVGDIKAAVKAIPNWMKAVGWSGPGALVDDWMVIGHSNGGQGVWYLITHYPDNVFAAAPVSGYTSIESKPPNAIYPCSGARSDVADYVPYNMWRDSEPLISSILHQSRASYKHELLLANAAGIPILQQHGSQDTNVPAYHSRLMHALLEETDWLSEYVELPNAGHWFDGVMTTPPLLKFYESSLHSARNRIPPTFAIYVPPSGDMSSKGGIFVDQLQSPDRLGRLHVTIDAQQKKWHLQTQNIHRFHLSANACNTKPHIVLVLDDMSTHFAVDPAQCDSTWYIRGADGNWMRSNQTSWRSMSQRYGRQVGALDAILRTNGPFTINICSANVEKTALQISRNLLQYFAADSQIIKRCDPFDSGYPGNVITISLGNELPAPVISSYPLRVTDNRIYLHRCFPAPSSIYASMNLTSSINCGKYYINHEPAMGALFLRPLSDERLELVVWGTDRDGLEQAARLVPTLTGAGQPEFLVLGESFQWKGHAGLHAAGHFDKFWQISAGSYIANGI